MGKLGNLKQVAGDAGHQLTGLGRGIVGKAQLFLHPAGFFVAVVVTAPDAVHFEILKGVAEHLARGFGNESLTPERLADPITKLVFIVTLGKILGVHDALHIPQDRNHLILRTADLGIEAAVVLDDAGDVFCLFVRNDLAFVDDDVPYGGHCYTVTGLCNYGNTPHSNEVCGVTTEDCEPARNLWYEYTSADKIKITWEAPANDEKLSGYYIMRKTSEDNEWKRVKVLGANKNDYTDTGANDDNLIYSYRVLAYYQDIDCLSSPAKARYGNEYMINVSTPTGLEDAQSQSLRLYPNPVDDNLKIEADEINSVTIFNLMGQKVYESNVDSDEVLIDMSSFQSGIYMIQIETVEYKVTKRISVLH